ncbi:MAG: efflux transporter outer membrane subunit [Desulfuromusa sp.]|jgi:multidrug efflux system outer membrane protein|nr:efflux transporter outer membrane subunit [Desulfuromusa sp.]
MKLLSRIIMVGFMGMLLNACTFGMDYQRPEALVPVQYKSDAPWKEAEPKDALSKGNWWEIYNDPALNELEEQATEANQSLQAAYSRLSQVQSNLGIRRADQLPRIDINASGYRQRVAEDLSITGNSYVGNQFSLPLVLGYEVDLWGRVKRSIEAAEADVEGAVANYQNLLLTLQTELAQNYFSLRAVDNEIDLLLQTIELRKATRDMVKSKFDNGQVGQLDLSRAESILAATEAEAIGLQKQRGEMENAIAVLIGLPPSSFSIAVAPLTQDPPPVTPGLPSDLLERRPDVAAAERQMAAASARIGVAKTAFFPAISLTGSAGFGSSQIDSLFDWNNRTWGLGPAVSLPIFDYGRNSANLDKTRALYDEAVANYRQQVLLAFMEVENGLNGLRVLNLQGQFLQQAAATAKHAWMLSEKRYRAGLVSYLEVVDTQRSALQAERSMVQLRGLQLRTSVHLIKALGGGWGMSGA